MKNKTLLLFIIIKNSVLILYIEIININYF